MLRGEYSRLREWLRGSRIPHVPLETIASTPAEKIRCLNSVESRFDGVIAEELTPAIDWEHIRHELGLELSQQDAWYDVADRAVDVFYERGYSPEQLARARRLWYDFVIVGPHILSETQAPEGWIAGLEYLIRRLYFVTPTKQREIAVRHHVSASTVSMRYRSLVEELGLVIFDHPSRKRLDALRTLAVDMGALSEGEFRSRLLAGDLSSL